MTLCREVRNVHSRPEKPRVSLVLIIIARAHGSALHTFKDSLRINFQNGIAREKETGRSRQLYMWNVYHKKEFHNYFSLTVFVPCVGAPSEQALPKAVEINFSEEGKGLKGRIRVAVNARVLAGMKCSYKRCVLLDSRIYSTPPVWDIQ